MDADGVKLPILNGNGIEDLEQHWVICEVVCTIRQIKGSIMIMTFIHQALYWYMNFSIVPMGSTHNTFIEIKAGFMD